MKLMFIACLLAAVVAAFLAIPGGAYLAGREAYCQSRGLDGTPGFCESVKHPRRAERIDNSDAAKDGRNTLDQRFVDEGFTGGPNSPHGGN